MFAVRVRIPATTANLGPGFDCLGLALDLWNEAEFRLEGTGPVLRIHGEGEGRLPENGDNLLLRAFFYYYRLQGLPNPSGPRVECRNAIPTGSGLGSSASAALLGLLAADTLSGCDLPKEDLLRMAVDLEGHADNAAAALYGGLAVTLGSEGGWLTRRFDVPSLCAAWVLPEFDFPTQMARKALPDRVARGDAIFNAARTPLVVEALRTGDLDLLGRVMDDRLHQPQRLPLIPGGLEAFQAAREAGAPAVAISGAGPSLIAFCRGDPAPVIAAMRAAFKEAGLASRGFALTTTSLGAQVEQV